MGATPPLVPERNAPQQARHSWKEKQERKSRERAGLS